MHGESEDERPVPVRQPVLPLSGSPPYWKPAWSWSPGLLRGNNCQFFPVFWVPECGGIAAASPAHEVGESVGGAAV